MTEPIPTVSDGLLFDTDALASIVQLDTPAWFAWLEKPTTDRFSYALHNRVQGYIDGFMTVRKERRQRGTAYWSAYRRQGQRLRKLYIGRSATLTQARLEEIAGRLRPRDGPDQTTLLLRSCRVFGASFRQPPLLIFKPESRRFDNRNLQLKIDNRKTGDLTG